MTKDDIVWRLAAMASLPYQQRYVIDGTIDEYAVDTEIIENVDGLRYLLDNPDNADVVDEAQRAALDDLFALIDTRSGEALARQSREEGAALIRDGEVWHTLRAKAAAALATFGVAVDDLSAKQVAELAD